MKRVLKLGFLILAIGSVLYAASYMGARARVGMILGSRPPDLGRRTIFFAYKGVPELPGRPRAWIFAYGPTAIPGAPELRLYVSPTGRLLRTHPHDLEARLAPYKELAQ